MQQLFGWIRPARGLVVSASATVLLPRPCKLVLQPSYQMSCREHTQKLKNKPCEMELEIVQNSVVALEHIICRHYCYKAPTTNHHIKTKLMYWLSRNML